MRVNVLRDTYGLAALYTYYVISNVKSRIYCYGF